MYKPMQPSQHTQLSDLQHPRIHEPTQSTQYSRLSDFRSKTGAVDKYSLNLNVCQKLKYMMKFPQF